MCADVVRVAVTGAAGQIGYALLTRLAEGALLGDRRIELRLLEVPKGLKALEGVAMELEDCAFPTLAGIQLSDDPREAFDGVNIAMLVGASPRTKGMERSDLLAANGRIFAEQGRALAAGAAADVRVVVTGNPANTNAYIAYRNAQDIPRNRFTALTRLDHDRAVAALARRTGAQIRDISRVAIWGNHSTTLYADTQHARIRERSAQEWVDDAWVAFDFIPAVAHRGAAVIAARGKSSAASAANATIEHMRDWLHGTAEGDWTSMAVPSNGEYGVDDGLVCSFPVTTADGEYHVAEGLRLSAFARAKIDASVAELRREAAEVQRLGIV